MYTYMCVYIHIHILYIYIYIGVHVRARTLHPATGLPEAAGQQACERLGGPKPYIYIYIYIYIFVCIYNIPSLIRNPPNKKTPLGGGEMLLTLNLDGGKITPLIKNKRCLVRSTPLIRKPPLGGNKYLLLSIQTEARLPPS